MFIRARVAARADAPRPEAPAILEADAASRGDLLQAREGGMMEPQRLTPETVAPPSGAYVHAVRAGGFLFVAGQVARGRDGQVVGEGDVAAQAAQVLDNVQAVLATAGCTLRDVVKITCYLTDIRHRAPVGVVRQRYFGEHLPASTTVEVSNLGERELLIEIDAVALIPERASGVADDEV
jgi:2-iminobutanoate/2-iminopropanoate deaminase